MTTPVVLITGGSGRLAPELADVFSGRGYAVTLHTGRGDGQFRGDLADVGVCERLLSDVRPDLILNAAALTSVDACERNPHAAYRGNAQLVANLSSWCQLAECKLIQISTDQVYSGLGPHREDNPGPVNHYGWSKLAGEEAALRCDAVVLRVNFVGRSRLLSKPSFSDWVVKHVGAGRACTLFADVYFNPLRMATVGLACRQLLTRWRGGVYNLGAKDGVSKEMFARALCSAIGTTDRGAVSGSVADAGLTARRPHDMRTDVSNFEEAFEWQAPSVGSEIKALAEEYAV